MADQPALARRLNTTDAVVIGLGSMIGAGVFAAFGPAARAAGTGLLIGLALAAAIAYCNASSSAQLAAVYPTSGGTYIYGRERLGPWWGFIAGWGFARSDRLFVVRGVGLLRDRQRRHVHNASAPRHKRLRLGRMPGTGRHPAVGIGDRGPGGIRRRNRRARNDCASAALSVQLWCESGDFAALSAQPTPRMRACQLQSGRTGGSSETAAGPASFSHRGDVVGDIDVGQSLHRHHINTVVAQCF